VVVVARELIDGAQAGGQLADERPAVKVPQLQYTAHILQVLHHQRLSLRSRPVPALPRGLSR
jgi:hypothetical protein